MGGNLYSEWNDTDSTMMRTVATSSLCSAKPPTVGLTALTVQDLIVAFAAFQSDDDLIHMAELAKLLDLICEGTHHPETLQKMVNCAAGPEAKGDVQALNLKQFLRFFIKFLPGNNVTVRSKDVFRVLDTDDSKSISLDELRRVLRTFGMSVSEDGARAMAELADTTKDDQIDIDEFRFIYRSLQGSSARRNASDV